MHRTGFSNRYLRSVAGHRLYRNGFCRTGGYYHYGTAADTEKKEGMRGTAGLSPFSMISQDVNQRHLVKQVRTPPVRPADGVVRCVYESFVPGVWHRWMEKEILWFCFRRAEPERMISGWTASSRDSSKTEEGKAPRGYGQIRSELRMSSKLKLSRILPL